MIQLLKSLFGEAAQKALQKDTDSKRATAPKPKPKPAHVDGDYRAVSLVPCSGCHSATRQSAGKRFLLREAPRLPLAGCAQPDQCTCKFRKHPDRREADRRLFGAAETGRWYAGAERRSHKARRAKLN
jgi:2-polyprenyl-6-methoxyphenol hydroxylase-like FAD-dependent oxidoreductase